MESQVVCQCGTKLTAPPGFAGGRALCPACRRQVEFPSIPAEMKPPREEEIVDAEVVSPPEINVIEFLDPPPRPAASQTTPAPEQPRTDWLRHMFTMLLDPQSIQWMLLLGGGLMVIGVIVWLVSLGLFKNTLALASVLTLGSLAVLTSGCALALRTKYHLAGRATAFLGCVLLPLNLWFYHAQGLMTLDGNLWLGGLVCCAIYAVIVIALRDPLFLYAVETGLTLTILLLLGNQGVISDTTWLSVVLMGLALVSIHAERAFSPDDLNFPRARFGLPLFWSGQLQLAASLLILLGSQLLSLLLRDEWRFLGLPHAWNWQGNALTQHSILAGGIWLLGAYAYLYSDLVVRRLGIYTYLAAMALVGAELTLIGARFPAEALIAAPAITSLVIVLLTLKNGEKDRLMQNLQPLALLLTIVAVIVGVSVHIRATSFWIREIGFHLETGWVFVLAMVVTIACQRISAWLLQTQSPRYAMIYLGLTGASALVLGASILRAAGVHEWTHQAALLMLIPIGYILAARSWRGQLLEQPLAVIAHVGTLVILLHLFFAAVQSITYQGPLPIRGEVTNLWIGLVMLEATLFYLLSAWFRTHGANIYAATATACCAVWQFASYYHVPDTAYVMLYAVLGLLMLIGSRLAGITSTTIYLRDGSEKQGLLGRGSAAFHSACALLTLACVSALLQNLARLATQQTSPDQLWSLGICAFAVLIAAGISPASAWRRVFATSAIGLAALWFVTLNTLLHFTFWQKAELFAIVIGGVMVLTSFVGRFMEKQREHNDLVTLGLWMGSFLVVFALLCATCYYRFSTGVISLPDELGLLFATVLLLVTGYSWRMQGPTAFGGLGLTIYLLILVGTLAYFPNVAIGVYLAIGGGLLFAFGIVLSIYRDRLVQLPEKFANRHGIFQFLNWR